MLTLGIETSCDETSVAVVESGSRILSNVILSQAVHTKFGGVIPEVASREHLRAILPIYEEALATADVTLDDIELVAATIGPGLVGPLLVGLSFAKGIAWGKSLPFVPVNHLEGHLSATLLEYPDIDKHHLCLIASGGHTLLIDVIEFSQYKILGGTKDDAAGEAFDKVAKILGLGYPGGAALSSLASKGDRKYVRFPRAVKQQPYAFSYSGLKTAVALHVEKLNEAELVEHKADIAASFQEAAVEVLVDKTIGAAVDMNVRDISVTGGVASNERLREMFTNRADEESMRLFFPSPNLCTDNAAMIATAGFLRYDKFGPGELIANAIPNLKLE